MQSDNILKRLRHTIRNYDEESAKEVAEEVISTGIKPVKAVNEAAKTLNEIGVMFEEGEIYLPHLVMAAEVMEAILNKLKPHLSSEEREATKRGVVVLGTVKGDLHDIGQNIVGAMLSASGFEVHNIGKDQPVENFVSKAEEVNADIIAASALLLVTIPELGKLIRELKDLGIRKKYKVMIGGGAVNESHVKKFGADGTGKDAREAVKVAKKLMRQRKNKKEGKKCS